MPSESVRFDHAADYYDETRGFPPGIEQQVAELICQAGKLTLSSRVFEVGIGTGRIALPLASHVRSVTGIDLARPMMNRLRAKQTTEPVALIEGDAVHLPLASSVFDAVIAVHIFHLISEWRAALREVARILCPSGVLLAGFNDDSKQQRNEVMEILWNAWEREIPPEQQQNVGVPRQQYQTYPADEGWQKIGEMSISFTVERHPAGTLGMLQRRMWSSCWRLTDEQIARGLAAMQDAIHQHQIDVNEPFTHTQVFTVQTYVPPES